MVKRITFATLILLSIFGLWSGIQYYRRNLETLQSSGLDGALFIGLIILGISVLLMPLQLRTTWEKWSAWGLVREYVIRFSLIIGTLLAIFLVFGLIAFIITLPARAGRGYLILPWLIVLVPLVMVMIDLAKQNIKRTAKNFVLGFGLYAFRIYGLLLIQFVTIPVAFVLFPAGFFLQLLSLGDLVARWGFNVFVGERPLLCDWFNLLDSCTPGLISLHVGHLILALLAAKFGQTLFDRASDWYRNSLEKMTSWVEPA
ncbi:MAG: hypothetical protein KC433_10545 [Anaerolineales bacterium]|nr:hypothetical protein [Anaerolineales bacterium]MCB8936856.1 hypothetical protein [Ardenticatenaceae bacterium]